MSPKRQDAPAREFVWRENFDAQAFLARVWQRRPLLIRQAWQAWHNPLAPDYLAGLACQPDVESRLVVRGKRGWRLEHGPLPASRFATLPKKNWTLLVQAVDHHVPAVATLLDAFRFLPDWRIDDVMVSYAVDGGSVGPHFDQYDVFLVQGLGQRRWQLGPRCDANTALLGHEDLGLLPGFEVKHDWLLDAGDILYLPPGYAHHGFGVGDDCMTYSIGFRAPSRADLLGHWADAVIDGLSEGDRYTDGTLVPVVNPGEIDAATIKRAHDMVRGLLADGDDFAAWFGRFATAPKYPELQARPQRPLDPPRFAARLARGGRLVRAPASRYGFVRHGRAVTLFVDGDAIKCRGAAACMAERLCAHNTWPNVATDLRTAAALELALDLYNRGALLFDHGR